MLIDKEAVKNHIRSTWKSDFFKKLADDESSTISILTESVSKYPVIFFDYSQEAIEKSHFTAWFRCIANRTYENPVIHDLYLYHELFHCFTLTETVCTRMKPDYDSKDGGILLEEKWGQLIIENEMYASLESEVFIYYRYPELRALAFKQEIWYDYLTSDLKLNKDRLFSDYTESIKNDLQRIGLIYHENYDPNEIRDCWGDLFPFGTTLNYIIMLRKFLMYGAYDRVEREQPYSYTFAEKQIAEYGKNNNKWVEIWKNRAPEIEKFLYRLVVDPEYLFYIESFGQLFADAYMGDRKTDLKSYGKFYHDEVPFILEAIKFTEVYNNREFKNF